MPSQKNSAARESGLGAGLINFIDRSENRLYKSGIRRGQLIPIMRSSTAKRLFQSPEHVSVIESFYLLSFGNSAVDAMKAMVAIAYNFETTLGNREFRYKSRESQKNDLLDIYNTYMKANLLANKPLIPQVLYTMRFSQISREFESIRDRMAEYEPNLKDADYDTSPFFDSNFGRRPIVRLKPQQLKRLTNSGGDEDEGVYYIYPVVDVFETTEKTAYSLWKLAQEKVIDPILCIVPKRGTSTLNVTIRSDGDNPVYVCMTTMSSTEPYTNGTNFTNFSVTDLIELISQKCDRFFNLIDDNVTDFVSFNTADELNESEDRCRLNVKGTNLIENSNANDEVLVWDDNEYTTITGITEKLVQSLKLDDGQKQWDFKVKSRPKSHEEQTYAFCNSLLKQFAKDKELNFQEFGNAKTKPSLKLTQSTNDASEFTNYLEKTLKLSEETITQIRKGMVLALNSLQALTDNKNVTFVPSCTKTGSKKDAFDACKRSLDFANDPKDSTPTVWNLEVNPNNEKNPVDINITKGNKSTTYYIVQILKYFFPIFTEKVNLKQGKNRLTQRNWQNNVRVQGVDAIEYFARLVGCDDNALNKNPPIFNFLPQLKINGIFVHIYGSHWDLYVPVNNYNTYQPSTRNRQNQFVRLAAASDGGCSLNCLSFYIVDDARQDQAIRKRQIGFGEEVYDRIKHIYSNQRSFPKSWLDFKKNWGTGNWSTPDLYLQDLGLSAAEFILLDLSDDDKILKKKGAFGWKDIFDQFKLTNGGATPVSKETLQQIKLAAT